MAEPILKTGLGELYLGDAIKFLKELPDESIDLWAQKVRQGEG